MPGFQQLLGPGSLTTSEILELLTAPIATSRRISRGKRKMYSVIDNRANVQWHRKGLNSVFDYDCGAWDSKSARYEIYLY